MTAPLRRRVLAELVGTGLLVCVVVGSGIAAQRLSSDTGIELLENALATAAGLAVLILALGPVSGAHFNPVVSLADWALGRRSRGGLSTADLGAYVGAQVTGAIAGCLLANLMFTLPAVTWSTRDRSGGSLWLAEVVATATLLLVIVSLARSGRAASTPWAVGAWIGAAYWFTASTSFANPAVTVGRAFTNSFAGIAPSSVPGFVLAQLAGGIAGVALVTQLFPHVATAAADIVVPHDAADLA